MNLFRNIFVLTGITSLLILIAPQGTGQTAPYGAFNINPVLPDNQLSESSSFYDLKLGTSEEQELTLDVNNTGTEAMLARITLFDGFTEENAEKSFERQVELDPSMRTPMTSFATLETNEIKVEAGETKSVHVKLKLPDEEFNGVSVGGITVTADYYDKTSKKVKGFSVGNRLSYVVAIQVRMNDNEVSKNLNYIKTELTYDGEKPTFLTYIQNDQPIVMNNVTIDGEIRDVNGNVIAEISKNNGGIYPNTNFPIKYNLLENEKLEKGKYKVDVAITSDEDTWQWEDIVNFEELDNHVEEEKNKDNFYVLVILLFIIIVILILYKLYSNKRIRGLDDA